MSQTRTSSFSLLRQNLDKMQMTSLYWLWRTHQFVQHIFLMRTQHYVANKNLLLLLVNKDANDIPLLTFTFINLCDSSNDDKLMLPPPLKPISMPLLCPLLFWSLLMIPLLLILPVYPLLLIAWRQCVSPLML